MTDRDDARVRKALQGKDFPAERNDLVAYATDRGEIDDATLTALGALPEGSYASIDDVVASVPRRPGTTPNRRRPRPSRPPRINSRPRYRLAAASRRLPFTQARCRWRRWSSGVRDRDQFCRSRAAWPEPSSRPRLMRRPGSGTR